MWRVQEIQNWNYLLYHSRKNNLWLPNSHLRNWLELKSQQTLANETARKWRHVFLKYDDSDAMFVILADQIRSYKYKSVGT